ncbi:MAG: ABC transporter substrate-binding protein [Ilumatobacter sp.]|nr:ABC transporter substrate-binding protein [Ilumatobacter sp.]
MRRTRLTHLAALGAATALTLAACGSDDDTPAATDAPPATDAPAATEAPADTEPAAGGAVDLSGVCPETIVIQTDWFPEAEHGALYQMIGEGASIDSDKKTVSGPLVTGDGPTGVNLEVRTGGPAIGFQQVVPTMAADTNITFGYVLTDEAIENYPDNPTTAFVAPLEINPQIIMWDPATYPDVETIADLKSADDGSGVTIRYFESGAYMQFLLSDGQVDESQLDGSYDGGPAVFIAEGGKIAQQGFASAEPYNYENVFEDWAKPVKFELIHDAGWQTYAAPLAVLDSKKDELTDCMRAFTPVVQQAVVDYVANPGPANELIVQAVNDYNDFWVYDAELGQWSVDQQVSLGLVGNGPDDIVGNFDEARVAGFIEVASPVFGVDGLTPADLVTNEFIDPSIGL